MKDLYAIQITCPANIDVNIRIMYESNGDILELSGFPPKLVLKNDQKFFGKDLKA